MQVVGGNAHVDDIGHDQWYEQVKCGFQHLEQRGKHALALVVPQIAKHVVQGYFLLFCSQYSGILPIIAHTAEKNHTFAGIDAEPKRRFSVEKDGKSCYTRR